MDLSLCLVETSLKEVVIFLCRNKNGMSRKTRLYIVLHYNVHNTSVHSSTRSSSRYFEYYFSSTRLFIVFLLTFDSFNWFQFYKTLNGEKTKERFPLISCNIKKTTTVYRHKQYIIFRLQNSLCWR